MSRHYWAGGQQAAVAAQNSIVYCHNPVASGVLVKVHSAILFASLTTTIGVETSFGIAGATLQSATFIVEKNPSNSVATKCQILINSSGAGFSPQICSILANTSFYIPFRQPVVLKEQQGLIFATNTQNVLFGASFEIEEEDL